EDLFREAPFHLAINPPGARASGPLDRIMLRGRIDVLVLHEGEFIVIDYKTRHLPVVHAHADAVYEPQLQVYCDAISSITGCRVKAAYLVLLSARLVVTKKEGSRSDDRPPVLA